MDTEQTGQMDPPPWHGADAPLPSDEEMPGWLEAEEGQDFFDPAELSGAAPAAPAPFTGLALGDEALDGFLRERFGLPGFREGQREVIRTVLSGRSAMTIMPTGSGKSLCYQLPAMLLPGLTLIVSPLIALMKDQVDSLHARGLPATYINSTLSWDEQRERLDAVRRGKIKMLFVAPERFRSAPFLRVLQAVQVSLFAVDEAHCVSEWGHDFRPDYLALGAVRQQLGAAMCLALTATATPQVRDDIRKQLRIPDADVFVSGFERQNLFLEVYKARGKNDKLARMEALLRHMGGASIVYCATRKAVEDIGGELAHGGFRVGMYHAGLTDQERDRVQDAFMRDEVQVLVATNAFGMGVDKPDIRATIHYQIPASLEAYYQEAGRAGRDGEPGHCLLLYNYADRHVPDFFIEASWPDRELIEDIWALLRRYGKGQHTLDAREIARRLKGKRNPMMVSSALRILRRAGHLTYDKQDRETIEVLDTDSRLRVDWADLDRHRGHESDKVQQVIFYAGGSKCRTLSILRYFDSRPTFRGGCGHCDVCVAAPPYASQAQASRPKLQAAASTSAGGGQRATKIAARAQQGKLEKLKTDEPVADVARKILACIARGRQQLPSSLVALILVGSGAQEVVNQGHHQLSTHGLLKGHRAEQVEALIGVMLKAGFLRLQSGAIGLTEPAVQVMKGAAALPPTLEEELEALFERPKDPQTAQAMRKLQADPDKGGALTQTVLTTLAMLISGKDLWAVAHERQIKPATITAHVITAARAGATADLDFTPYLDGAILPAVRTVAEDRDWEAGLREFRDEINQSLGRKISYEVLKMHIAWLIRQGELR